MFSKLCQRDISNRVSQRVVTGKKVSSTFKVVFLPVCQRPERVGTFRVMLFPFIGLVHINRFQGPRRNAAQINKSRASPHSTSVTLRFYTAHHSTNQTHLGHTANIDLSSNLYLLESAKHINTGRSIRLTSELWINYRRNSSRRLLVMYPRRISRTFSLSQRSFATAQRDTLAHLRNLP